MYNVHVHIQCTYAPKLVQVNVRYANISCLIFVGKGHQPKIFNNENFTIYGTLFCTANVGAYMVYMYMYIVVGEGRKPALACVIARTPDSEVSIA